MISPIQLVSFRLDELSFAANPEWQEPQPGDNAFRLSARGDVLFENESEEGELRPPFSLDVTTSLEVFEGEEDGTPVTELEVGVTYDVFLWLEVNTEEEMRSRVPFVASLACAAELVLLSVPDSKGKRRSSVPVVRANAAGMLYGMARDLLLQISQSTASIILPSLSFKTIVEHEAQVEAAERAADEA